MRDAVDWLKGIACVALLGLLPQKALSHEWAPIPARELELKDSPTHPGAPAIILCNEVLCDDEAQYTYFHKRIKVLKPEGREYADVELPFEKDLCRITRLHARTVRPDGTSIDFAGQVFEKSLVKSKDAQWFSKTFSLPEVEVGSIVEWEYRLQLDRNPFLVFNMRWNLQEELPTLRSTFSRKPIKGALLRCVLSHLPPGVKPREDEDKVLRLDLDNVPPVEVEGFMPPLEETMWRVDFDYPLENESSAQFWKRVGIELWKVSEKFIGNHAEIAREAVGLVSPGDPSEVKLRKLYTRAQRVRNFDYEPLSATPPNNQDVAETLKQNYGRGSDINALFVALCRGAGFEAAVAHVAMRDKYFFNPSYHEAGQLNAYLSVVRVDTVDVYLDPASRITPFGLLSWEQSGVTGVCLDQEGGRPIKSPTPRSRDAVIERVARFDLHNGGELEGRLEVRFIGQEALVRRSRHYFEDVDTKTLKICEEIQARLSPKAQVSIDSVVNWDRYDAPLLVYSKLRMKDVATFTGRRLLLPGALLQAGGKPLFQSPERVHAVYFPYPYQERDSVAVTLPEGMQVESLPEGLDDLSPFGALTSRYKKSEHTVTFSRSLTVDGYYFRVEQYPRLRAFFNRVRSADAECMVFSMAAATEGR